MNLFNSKSRFVLLLSAGLSLFLMSSVAYAQRDDNQSQEKKGRSRDEGSKGSSRNQSDSRSQSPPNRRNSSRYDDSSSSKGDNSTRNRDSRDSRDQKSGGSSDTGKDSGHRTDDISRSRNDRSTSATEKKAPVPQPTLHTKQVGNGQEKVTVSGQIREKTEKKADGEHTKYIAPTGRVNTEVVAKPNGARETIHYAPNGKVQKTVVVAKDGMRETTSVQYGRNGNERASETIKVDARGREVSKTVVVKQSTVIIKNTTIVNNRTIVRNYDRARFGFVYHPVYVVHSPVFVSWYDPYWYGPRGVWISHPFHYRWGWDDYGWYRWHRHYWTCYDVYPTPAYWMTDWLIAGYVADRYAAAVSVDQAREEARLAREDADRAREAADRAREDAEIAEARAAQREAEARLAKAEALTAKAEAEESRAKARGDQPNANATPIDPQTKEALRSQIEQAVAEKKEFAEQAAKGGNPVPADISKALGDPKHIYPVSNPINVISAADQSPAGALSEGDLLKLEPGQGAALKDANENTFVTMRVMSSKGDEGEAKAGTLVMVTLKNLQDFDSEFRAKLDLGLAEADKNKDQFKTDGSRAER